MKVGEAVASQNVVPLIHTYSISNVPAACAQHSTLGPRTPSMRTLHKQHFCRSAGALSFSPAATVKEELANAAEGGSRGGEGPPWRRWRLRSWRRRRATRR
eukprot:472346-Prymnesium_polylepis.1